ncbi:MAG: pilus assembly protein TadG-related protein [Candidatus Limnocylindrales bacterium]
MPTSAREPQRGQALTLFALALTAIVLASAVVVDGGYAYAQRRQSQNAADFAAMAGTRIIGSKLTGQPANAGTAANVRDAITSTLSANDSQLVSARYIDHTGADLGDVTTASIIPDDAFGIVVSARTNWEPFLLGAIGVTDWIAGAKATAMTPGESKGGTVLPVGIDDVTYNALDDCDADVLGTCFQSLTPGELIAEGNFGWMKFGLQGNGGKCDWAYSLGMEADGGCQNNQPFLQSQIWPEPDAHGCCGPVGAPGPNGEVNENKIGALTGNEWGDLSHYVDEKIPVWIPIYSGTGPKGGSNAYYEIVGFGAIVFTGSGTEHAKWLRGYRVDELACQDPSDPTTKYCLAPGGSFKFDVTGEVQLRR